MEWQWLQLGTNLSWPILSPTGDRIRSKVELTRYLGPACDLTLFDFKQGVLCYPSPKVLYGVEYSGTGAEPLLTPTHGSPSFLPLLSFPGSFLGHHQQEAEEAFEASQGSEVSGWTSEE